MAKNIMIQGTMSNAGKSILCAGLCRIFRQDGYRVAPFKSQNMALNSFITAAGGEMGRAQVVQAEAAGIAPDVRMNLILLKPTTDVGSQVIVNGVVQGNMHAMEYYRRKREYIPAVMEAYNSLAAENDILVIEGAIWVNFSVPAFIHTPLYFMGYLIVSSIQMGANIDYAIVIATRYNELRDKMDHKTAMIETLNFAFPTILTSGTIMTVAGTLIGQMTSDACIVGIGQCLGRGTIISIFLVLFVLPQILLVGGKLVDKTSFSMHHVVLHTNTASGRVRVNGMVQGEVNGSVAGTMNAVVDGNVHLTVLSGKISQEVQDENDSHADE